MGAFDNVDTALVIFMITTIVLLIASMILSGMAASAAQQGNTTNARKYSAICAVVNAVSIAVIAVALAVYIYLRFDSDGSSGSSSSSGSSKSSRPTQTKLTKDEIRAIENVRRENIRLRNVQQQFEEAQQAAREAQVKVGGDLSTILNQSSQLNNSRMGNATQTSRILDNSALNMTRQPVTPGFKPQPFAQGTRLGQSGFVTRR